MYLTIKDYFEHLGTHAKFLKGFAGFFDRELLTKINSYDGLENPYLALFKYSIALEGNEQNTQANRQIGFVIAFGKIDAGNYAAQYKAIDDAEKFAFKVLARIKYDNARKDFFLWNSLIKESIQINPFELENGEFGAEVFFNIKNPQSLVCDITDWDDLTDKCP